ncbi:MAG: DinB family protein [Chloroflexi bacterium]|nr:DinB family protein [Chloroflexota bacterium]MCC6892994.1 DinB family protein [Anaerolineae bacterium]
MSDSITRAHLVDLLVRGNAHMSLEEAVKNFPAKDYNTRPPNVEYSFWHLLEHIRLTQHDILDYSRNPDYKYIQWPQDYWPAKDATTDAAGWKQTIDGFIADRAAMVAIVDDPQTDLYGQIPHGERGHTILREVLVVADHNAYHIGELGILRQVVGNW